MKWGVLTYCMGNCWCSIQWFSGLNLNPNADLSSHGTDKYQKVVVNVMICLHERTKIWRILHIAPNDATYAEQASSSTLAPREDLAMGDNSSLSSGLILWFLFFGKVHRDFVNTFSINNFNFFLARPPFLLLNKLRGAIKSKRNNTVNGFKYCYLTLIIQIYIFFFK